ncbi:MAG TPA: T9SS type A sorting domain-containing protein, partial [Candidatus Kapabacteria bacterium]
LGLPRNINKNSFYNVEVFYRGTEYDAKDTAVIKWKTDVNEPYSDSIKTYSTLHGCTMSRSGVRGQASTTLSIHSLTPNPAKDYLQLRYFSTSKITMTITNELGNESMKIELMPSEGPETSTRINLPQLTGGSYTLRLQNADGEVASQRFVVVK